MNEVCSIWFPSIHFFTNVAFHLNFQYSDQFQISTSFQNLPMTFSRQSSHNLQNLETLLFHQLRKEFQCLNNEHIKVDTVKADNWFSLDIEDLIDKICNKYKEHHIFIDEVGIRYESDIFLLKKVADIMTQQSKFFWISITYSGDTLGDFQEKVTSELHQSFRIIKDELNMPLRNTLSIVGAAYQKSKLLISWCSHFT